MQFNLRIVRLISCLSATLTVATLVPYAARADVKIDTEIHVTGSISTLTLGGGGRRGQSSADSGTGSTSSDAASAPADSTTQVTTYYKGNMARREVTNGRLVTLYDTAAKKVTLINTELKTYCIISEKEDAKIQANPISLPPPSATPTTPAGMTLDTSADIDATGLVQTTIGKETHKFTAYGALRLIRQQSSLGSGYSGRRGRGRGGSGGGGQGGDGSGGSGQGGARSGSGIPSIDFTGEYWLTDTANLPSGAKIPLLSMLRQTVPDGPILAALYGKVERLKQIPLASKMTFGASSVDPSTRPTVVIEMQVKSITDEPLDDALFKVPDGYQKVGSDALLRQSHLSQ